MIASEFLRGFELQRARLPGIEINYASAGTGSLVLLLNRHSQTHVVWRKAAPLFVAAGYQAIAPDLSG